MRPRKVAQLRFTTADVEYMVENMTVDRPDAPVLQERRRLVNPSGGQVLRQISEGSSWLGKFCADRNWDGGGLWFGFAGHGRSGDGALVFDDGSVLTATDFLNSCSKLAGQLAGEGRLRLTVVLDSCYSGAFVLDLLDQVGRHHGDSLVPFHVFASTFPDEEAWELPDIGHGLATFSWSVKANSVGSVGAEAVGPDNAPIPTLSLAAAPFGVPLLTAGRQHTLGHFNGTGHLTVLQEDVPLFDNDRLRSRDHVADDLFAIRDVTRDLFRQYRALTGVQFRDE